jgi:hypothetical protein
MFAQSTTQLSTLSRIVHVLSPQTPPQSTRHVAAVSPVSHVLFPSPHVPMQSVGQPVVFSVGSHIVSPHAPTQSR